MIVGAPTSPYPWCDPKEPVSLSIARRTQALPILRRLDRNCSPGLVSATSSSGSPASQRFSRSRQPSALTPQVACRREGLLRIFVELNFVQPLFVRCNPRERHGNGNPRRFRKIAYSVCDPPIKRRLRCNSPNLRLATRCGTKIFPSRSPWGDRQCTPSAALDQILPSSSTVMPSQ
jgi:hypothetical protein